MTDKEINELVARKLGVWPNYNPDYCHSIEAAWEVVEFMRHKYQFDLAVSGKCCAAHFSGPTWKQVISAEAESAPMAICLAFLKLEDR